MDVTLRLIMFDPIDDADFLPGHFVTSTWKESEWSGPVSYERERHPPAL